MSAMLNIKQTDNLALIQNDFNLIYKNLYPQLFNKLRTKYIPPLIEAEVKDIVQDTFYKVLDKRKNYIPGNSVFNWTYTISKNLAINFIIKFKNNQESFEKKTISTVKDEYEFDENDISDNSNLEDDVSEKDLVINILKIIDSISDTTDRRIVYLRLVDSLGYEEISKDVNLVVSTVHYRFNKKMNELKMKFDELIK